MRCSAVYMVMVGCKPVAGCSHCHRVEGLKTCVGCCMLLQHCSCAAGCCCRYSTGRGDTWRLVPKAVCIWYWCIHFTCTNEEAVGRPAGRVWQRTSAVAPDVCGFHSSWGRAVVCFGFRVVLLKCCMCCSRRRYACTMHAVVQD